MTNRRDRARKFRAALGEWAGFKPKPYADLEIVYAEETDGRRAENLAREVSTGQMNPEDE